MRRPKLILGLAFGLCALGIGVTLSARADDSDIHSARWSQLKNHLFGDRSIQDGSGGIIQLEVPLRPDNAAAVPIAVKSSVPQSPDRYVKNVFIVVDNNPEPLVGTFHLTPDSGLADLATNIRVQTHSSVRAIAEMNNGELFMSSKFVKASGGCAIPPPVTATVPAHLGQMLIRTQGATILNQPNWVQLVITHPNHTGMQYDLFKGFLILAHFIEKITVSYGDNTILTAETGISISEDPNFRFYFIPRAASVLRAEVKDSKGLTFTTSVEVTAKLATEVPR
jgi:sulfur-oxidizing protein SoxY